MPAGQRHGSGIVTPGDGLCSKEVPVPSRHSQRDQVLWQAVSGDLQPAGLLFLPGGLGELLKW